MMTTRTLVTTSLLAMLTAALVGCGGKSDAPPTAANPAAAQDAPLAKRLASRSPVPSRRARPAKRGAAATTTLAPATVADAAIPARYRAFAAAFDFERQGFGAPGAAVALIEGGQVTFAHGFGTAGPNSTQPVDASTVFRIGTTTMALTSAAALALVDQGKGALGESLANLVPHVALHPGRAAQLTVRDLLSMQSGLFDFTVLGSDPNLTSLSCSTDPSALGSFVTGSVFAQNALFMNRPGLFYTSSYPSFILAGAGIENESGSFFPSAMSTLLFQPLGMTRTFFLPSDVVGAGNYSDGLSSNPDGSPWDVAPDAYDCAAYRPYGYAFSSVSDLARFVQMLLGAGPPVLSTTSRLAMQSAQVSTRDFGQITAEGYGLTVQTGYVSPANVYYPTTTVSSVGAMPGFTSEVYFFPETGFGFVALASTDGAVFKRSLDIAVQHFAGLPGPAPLPASTNAVPGDFARYAGTYSDATGVLGTIVVSEKGGALTIDFPDAATLGLTFYPELSPVFNGSFLFVLDGGFTPLSFIPDASGRYDHLVVADLLAATRVPSAHPGG